MLRILSDESRRTSAWMWKTAAFAMYRQIELDFRTIRIHMARVSVEEGNSLVTYPHGVDTVCGRQISLQSRR